MQVVPRQPSLLALFLRGLIFGRVKGGGNRFLEFSWNQVRNLQQILTRAHTLNGAMPSKNSDTCYVTTERGNRLLGIGSVESMPEPEFVNV
jgi:hypothetical protein